MGKRPRGSSQPSSSSSRSLQQRSGHKISSSQQQQHPPSHQQHPSRSQQQHQPLSTSQQQQHPRSSQQQLQFLSTSERQCQSPSSSSSQQSEPLSSSHEAPLTNTGSVSSTEGSTATKRKGRGLSKKTKDWGKKKIIIEFNNLGQPKEGEWSKLATQMGFMIKNGDKFPLTVEEWPQIEQAQKDSAWEEIKDNTNLTDACKDYVISNMGGQWKDWKERVKKKGYNVYETDEERLMNRPEGVALDQWPVLVAKWGKEDFLKISAINKENRSKQGLAHRLGKKPMSIFIEERAKQGLPIDRLSLFLASRANNAGRSSDPATQQMIDALNEALEDLPEEERNDPSTREKIFIDHFGKDGRGRMRCMGRGPTITSMFGRGASASSHVGLQEKVDELESKLVSQKEEFQEELDSKLVSQKEEFQSLLMAEREANRLAMESLTAKLLSQFQNTSPSGIVPTASSGHPAHMTSSSEGAIGDTP